MDNNDKNVGRELKMAMIIGLVPSCYVSYCNRGKLIRYSFACVSIASFANIIRYVLKYLLTLSGS